jgi:hypothetical protein
VIAGDNKVFYTSGEDEQMNAEVSAFKDDYWASRGCRKLRTYVGPPLKKNLVEKAYEEPSPISTPRLILQEI